MRNVLDPSSELDAELAATAGGNYPTFEEYPTEQIAGLKFCAWPGEPEEITIAPTLRFGAIVILVCAALFGGSLALVRFMFINPDLGGQIMKYFALTIMIGTYGGMIIAMLLMRRPKKANAEMRPSGVPSTAVPVLVSARGHDTRLGRTPGWMWVDKSWLCFRGKTFGFRLQASDFKSKVNSGTLTGVLYFKLPKGFPTSGVWIYRRFLPDDRFKKWTYKELLEPDLEPWRSAGQTTETRLYPPVRSRSRVVNMVPSLIAWTAIGLILGAMLGGFFALMPEGVGPKGNPLTVCITLGLFLPFMMGFSVLGEKLNRSSREKELMKAAETSIRSPL